VASRRGADERQVADLGDVSLYEIFFPKARQHLNKHWTLKEIFRIRIEWVSGEKIYIYHVRSWNIITMDTELKIAVRDLQREIGTISTGEAIA
jgi:hypothetical protein